MSRTCRLRRRLPRRPSARSPVRRRHRSTSSCRSFRQRWPHPPCGARSRSSGHRRPSRSRAIAPVAWTRCRRRPPWTPMPAASVVARDTLPRTRRCPATPVPDAGLARAERGRVAGVGRLALPPACSRRGATAVPATRPTATAPPGAAGGVDRWSQTSVRSTRGRKDPTGSPPPGPPRLARPRRLPFDESSTRPGAAAASRRVRCMVVCLLGGSPPWSAPVPCPPEVLLHGPPRPTSRDGTAPARRCRARAGAEPAVQTSRSTTVTSWNVSISAPRRLTAPSAARSRG